MSNPVARFERYRRLLSLAYRMLGSMADAEDAVQETYLRWHGADRDNVSDPRASLMTTTTRGAHPLQFGVLSLEFFHAFEIGDGGACVTSTSS